MSCNKNSNYNTPNPSGRERNPISFQPEGLIFQRNAHSSIPLEYTYDKSKVKKEILEMFSIDEDNSTQSEKKGCSGVKECKNPILKERIRTLIIKKGLSESEFYNSIGISRQYWYYLSWGIWETPTHLKVRISKELDVDSSVIWNNNNCKGGVE